MSQNGSFHDGTGRRDVELTEFRYTILYMLADGSDYGLGIKRRLQDYYGQDINHGKLYPNLDELAIAGLVSKGKRDNRTNEYAITPDGLEAAVDRLEWALDHLIDQESTVESLTETIESEVLPG